MTQRTWADGGTSVEALVVEALDVGYATRRVLSSVSFVCEPGELCAIVGTNGAGKSSLLRVMAGVQPAQRGEVRLGEMKVHPGGGKELAKRRAYMEQGEAPGFEYTVAEIVTMGDYAWRRGWGPQGEDAHERARGYLEHVGLQGQGSRSVRELSGGERRRVMLARVMATRAGWWMLDEPLSGLDLKVQGEVMDVVRAHCASGGGCVMVCHDVNWVMARCQRVVVCDRGVLQVQGTPEEVLTHALISEVFGVEAFGVDVFEASVSQAREGSAKRWIHQA